MPTLLNTILSIEDYICNYCGHVFRRANKGQLERCPRCTKQDTRIMTPLESHNLRIRRLERMF